MAKQSEPTFRATFYTDNSLGQLGLGQLNEVGRAKGAVQAYHRGNVMADGEAPFAVANDFIGSQAGRLLGLPIPPGAITRSDVDISRPMYSCLDFDWTRETLVAAEPEDCIRDLLDDCTCLVLFDIWIANPDRMPQNLNADHPTRPTFLRVYDHADSLFNIEGESRLTELKLKSLGLSWPIRKNKEQHYLLKHLTSSQFRDKWLDRINRIPEFQIEHICQAARAGGISEKQASAAFEFLTYRMHNLDAIIHANRIHFCESFFAP